MPSISYQETVEVSLELILLNDEVSIESIAAGLNNGTFTKSITDGLVLNENGEAVAKIVDVDESDVENDVFKVESKD